jgi:hypothetical protein
LSASSRKENYVLYSFLRCLQPYWGLWLALPVVLAPIVYGLIGFLMGALTAWAYNFAARQIGGIQLELRPVIPSPSM